MKKSQSELEQPAKVYQVDAVEVKVDQMLIQLDTILKRTNGLVTHSQLESFKKEFKDDLQEMREENAPKFKRNDRIYVLLFTNLVGLLAAAVTVIFITRG